MTDDEIYDLGHKVYHETFKDKIEAEKQKCLARLKERYNMTEAEIERLVIDYQCYDVQDLEKMKAMTDEEKEIFRRKNTEFLVTQRCARPM